MITSREYTAERLRRVENYFDEPFEDNGKYTTISGDTLFSKLEEIGETLQCIRDTGDEAADPKTYTITETDLTELEGAVHEANRERIFLKGLVVELENAIKVLTEEHRVLSEITGYLPDEELEDDPELKEKAQKLAEEMHELQKKDLVKEWAQEPGISPEERQERIQYIHFWNDPRKIEEQVKLLYKMLISKKRREKGNK